MPRCCTICTHPERTRIERSLLARNGSFRAIARQYRIGRCALLRHRPHVGKAMLLAHAAREEKAADDLLKELRLLRTKAYSLLLSAEKEGDLKTALAGVREARGCLELLARLLGELQEAPTVNLILSPEWVQLRTRILTALVPFPEAKRALAEALDVGA